MMSSFAEVAVSLPMDRTFHYSIPDNILADIKIGKRVFVPFLNRSIVGYVVGLTDTADVKNVKSIISIIDKEPVVSEEMLKLTKWVKDNYFCSWGEAIAAVIPAGIKKGKEAIGSRIKESVFSSEKFPPSKPHDLMEEQSQALKSVRGSVDKHEYKTFLLHGITSSGKTEV